MRDHDRRHAVSYDYDSLMQVALCSCSCRSFSFVHAMALVHLAGLRHRLAIHRHELHLFLFYMAGLHAMRTACRLCRCCCSVVTSFLWRPPLVHKWHSSTRLRQIICEPSLVRPHVCTREKKIYANCVRSVDFGAGCAFYGGQMLSQRGEWTGNTQKKQNKLLLLCEMMCCCVLIALHQATIVQLMTYYIFVSRIIRHTTIRHNGVNLK